MKPAFIPLPPHLAPHIPADVAQRLVGIGNAALLAEPLLGFIASRQCPGHVFIETLDRVPQWASAGRVLISGFHSPLEQQVLRSLLRRQGHAVKLLARHLPADRAWRPTAEEREPLAQGRLLILSASPAAEARTTRASSIARNRLVLALATEALRISASD
ncbi:MAG: hypothetical protein OZ923_02475 [Comamonadaceae bacterium]|nr:hypothetical protein [Burkholderiales bacterium]MEB2347456.1 hypothetical protein [Comamonadaceae bacterium]